MRCVIQRVASAEVRVDDRLCGRIDAGLVAMLGVEEGDADADLRYCVDKTANLRIFEDEQGKMNRSVLDVGGAVLAVSKFTLHGDARKGLRPSFIRAARPEQAIPLYNAYCDGLRAAGLQVAEGEFQAHMRVALVNDGPVTILLDSRRAF
jgi:D-tyrosyl-tRNA(Tyr) deacylase